MSGQSIARAVLSASDGTSLPCQFNPSTVQVTKSANWNSQPARGSGSQPRPQFVGSGPEVLSVKLLFDSFDKLGGTQPVVEEAVERLLSWTAVSQDAYSSGTPQPPALNFGWGTGLSFNGFLQKVNATYTMFSPDGTPLRATADITLQRFPDDQQGTNPTSGGIAGRRCAQVGEGDSLASIAQREYGDPGLWRALAAANGVEDPTRLREGIRLLVPPRTQAAEFAAGEAV
jgi:phage protein U